MKAILIAALMSVGVTALASTADYGPGAYTKTVKSCGYGRYSSSPDDCKMMTYKFYAPRKETVCNKEGNGQKITCFDRVSTGNWGSRKFSSRAEARETQRREEKNGSN